jgi:hypothetical protein
VNPHLGNAFANGRAIAKIAVFRTGQPSQYPRLALPIREPEKPFGEDWRLNSDASQTRYDKLLANFMGFVKLAAIAIWLK